jgi:hypothetical protein
LLNKLSKSFINLAEKKYFLHHIIFLRAKVYHQQVIALLHILPLSLPPFMLFIQLTPEGKKDLFLLYFDL